MTKTNKTNIRKWMKTPLGISVLILISGFILMIIGAISANAIFHKAGRIVFIWSIAALIFLNTVEGLKSGTIHLKTVVVHKRKKPVLFWMSAVVGFGFFLFLFVAGSASLFM